MAACNTYRTLHCTFLEQKILQHNSTKVRSYMSYNQSIILKSIAPVSHEECNKTRKERNHVYQGTRLYSQNMPNKNRQIIPAILSYFSGAQREIRERRTDGIPLHGPKERNYMHMVYSLRSPGGGYGKSSPIPSMFYTIQSVNLVGLISAAIATGLGVTGNLSLQIPWSDHIVLDQIGIGTICFTSSIMLLGFAFALWRFPIR